ncbi:hypothetical protein ANCDUO_21415 [Ancylostoma duodenale]|uniref:Flavin-containing monooxygenase n=1 Tax=Ancylostoma duodenale TaxID=51022 RepID=A0A0C2FP80_9BILA|nr:hypothetical protein ANCDUO_21415 [Ancylostoma duodenale]
MYAEHFDLMKHIQFNVVVKYITEEDNGFRVELENGALEHFEKVMLCTGHHAEPLHPQLRGLSFGWFSFFIDK